MSNTTHISAKRKNKEHPLIEVLHNLKMHPSLERHCSWPEDSEWNFLFNFPTKNKRKMDKALKALREAVK